MSVVPNLLNLLTFSKKKKGNIVTQPLSAESYPHCIDLRAILKEIPDAWPEFIPQIGELFELSQGVERAICLKQKKGEKNNI